MKLSNFAVAAALVALPAECTEPVFAQVDTCDVIPFNYRWNYVNVGVEVNVPMHKVCIGISSEDVAVNSVTPSKEKPFCFDTGVEAMQILTPKLTLVDGTVVSLNPMGLDDARLTMKLAQKRCLDKLGPTL
jgi:hypothetical protein